MSSRAVQLNAIEGSRGRGNNRGGLGQVSGTKQIRLTPEQDQTEQPILTAVFITSGVPEQVRAVAGIEYDDNREKWIQVASEDGEVDVITFLLLLGVYL